MSFWTILRFQLGRRNAIEAVAGNRAALFTGMWLVLLTAIARNYDQRYYTEFWLFAPLIFSFFSGSFLFLILYHGFIRRRLEEPKEVPKFAQWRSFMALFWMTAPVAWLYAIPVERFLSSYQAAQANLSLLGLVSIWRVLLMARIISVLQSIPYPRAIGWVLVPACLEVLVVVFFGGFFGTTFSQRVLAGMGGMRNAPEENLILSTLGTVFNGSLILLPICMVILKGYAFNKTVNPLPVATKGRFPLLTLFLLSAAWVMVAIPAQLEQRRFATHAKLIQEEKYRESVVYLARYNPKDFPPSRRIEPNPFEYRAWEELPEVVATLQVTDPLWVRQLYIGHMDILFSHLWLRCKPDGLARMFAGLEHLPEGKSWLNNHPTALRKIENLIENEKARHPEDAEISGITQLTNVLRRVGANLDKPKSPENP